MRLRRKNHNGAKAAAAPISPFMAAITPGPVADPNREQSYSDKIATI